MTVFAHLSQRFVRGMVAAAVAGSILAPSAAAEFGPIELVSKTPHEQGRSAVEPAISADGRYLAFCGAIGGREGVFRVQLEADQVVPVAAIGASAGSNCGERAYARSPSISAEGRYVSFTTKIALDPIDDDEPETSDVYVADMATSPPSYELASAGDGSSEALGGGSLAAGRVALSEDGRRVAFVNQGEVYVRNLGTTTTTLISARRDPATGQMTSEPPEPVPGGGAYQPAGAAISGDGSTVAWVGEDLPEQVPLLGDEEGTIASVAQYLEPLWRRVPGEDHVPATRRIVGGGDPLAPGCPPGGTMDVPACRGPYPELARNHVLISTEDEGAGWGKSLPQLSADGNTVATIGDPEEDSDLYVVDMAPGLSRNEAVRQVTRWTNPNPSLLSPDVVLQQEQYWPFTGKLTACTISPDGSRVAFTTTRQNFPLAPPTLVTPRPANLGTAAELYQVDLVGGTIERATPGPGQDVSVGSSGASSPSYGAGGRVLAFGSDAYNLVSGDANENGDVFVVETPSKATVGVSAISSLPPALVRQPSWRLTANALSRPNGSIRIVAVVPGHGVLRARANAQLRARLRTRQVARGRRRAPAARVVRLELQLPPRLSHLSHQPGGLAAAVSISFAGPGGQPLHALLDSRFRVRPKASHARGKRTAR